MIELPFTNGFYQSRSLPLSSQRCINWYVNVNEAAAYSRENLFGTAGISQIDAGLPLEPNRGAHVMNEIPYFVNGNKLYSVTRVVNPDLSETFTVNNLGTITGTGRVSMADNGSQLCIVVPGGDAYIYDGALQTISDPDFDGPCETVVYIDGYFVFNKTNSNKIFHSELRDGLNYNALDFAEAEADPDNTVALFVDRNTLYVLGKETIEPYSNVGGTEFVFSPVRGGVLNKGLRSRFLVFKSSSGFIFVGSGESESESVWLFQGGSVTKLSTVPIDELIQDATPEQLDEGFSFYHSINGAEFWGATIGNTTIVFDGLASRLAGRKVWHERSSRIGDEDVYWRVSSIVSAYNRQLVGDLEDGRIGELGDNIRTEYGEEIIRLCSTQPFDNGGESMTVSTLEATGTSGSGTYDKDPQLGMSYSDDGGRTFSNILFRGLGKMGQYGRRAIWRRLGRFPKTRVLQFHFSETTDPTFNKLEARVR